MNGKRMGGKIMGGKMIEIKQLLGPAELLASQPGAARLCSDHEARKPQRGNGPAGPGGSGRPAGGRIEVG